MISQFCHEIHKNLAFIAIESNCSLMVIYKLVNAI